MRQPAQIHTEWTALWLSLAFQTPVVVWAATHWIAAILALGPFELIRLILLRSVSGAYREYGDPWNAVKTFAKRAAIFLGLFVGILLANGIGVFGVPKFVEVLEDPSIWLSVVIPVGVLIAESALSLFFFRGDVRVQAARFDAMAADATCWYVLFTLLIPGLLLVAFGIAIFLTEASRTHVSDGFVNIFALVVACYPAAYFSGKAIILAQVYTDRFALTGRRVLDAPWALFITAPKQQRSSTTQRIENYAIQWRRAAMLDAEEPDEL